MNALALLYVGFGGAIGSMARYLVITWVNRLSDSDFPFGTFAVNVIGGLLMGIWIGSMAVMLPAKTRDLHLLFAVGALGGFTTFSAFTVDCYLLLQRGQFTQGAVYMVSSVTVSLTAFFLGLWLLRSVTA